MPTPFTHLAVAQRLLDDPQLPEAVRALLLRERPAFLLGSIAADARISGNINREATHFFSYDRPIHERAWRMMLDQHPQLRLTRDEAQRAFLAGYVAHLSMDELWSVAMVRPHFFSAAWGDPHLRFLMLHIILIYMDERDYALLADWQRDTLALAMPHDWAPFIGDAALAAWRDFIDGQIRPGVSLTHAVFGERIRVSSDELRGILADPERMERDLWAHVPQELLLDVERQMYDFAREQMVIYCAG